MNRTVWLVEQGEYSDYHVVGIFSSEENARLIADAINAGEGRGDDAKIVARQLDPAVEELHAGLRQYHVLMRRDGEVEQCRLHEEILVFDLEATARIWERSKARAYEGTDTPDVFDATVWARDEKHAVKIVNERRAQMIALGKWKET